MKCPVCDGRGWLKAAAVKDSEDGAWVATFTSIPCFACYPTRLVVIA